MTREEAIEIYRKQQSLCLRENDWYKALDIAIKSLEAWDKVIEEIENHRRKTKSIDKYDLVGDCLDIIKNYMKEVEE